MSFFKKLFGVESIDESMNNTAKLMQEMADESERVHRNMVELYNKEVGNGMLEGTESEPSWRGIFKTRFLATMYSLFMFNNKWSKQNKKKMMELVNIASGIAIYSLHDSGSEYERNEAKELVTPFVRKSLLAIKNEFTSGPSKPSENYYTDGFKKLMEISHDALSESIGTENYTQEVKDRFNLTLISGVTSSLRVTVDEFGTPN